MCVTKVMVLKYDYICPVINCYYKALEEDELDQYCPMCNLKFKVPALGYQVKLQISDSTGEMVVRA